MSSLSQSGSTPKFESNRALQVLVVVGLFAILALAITAFVFTSGVTVEQPGRINNTNKTEQK
jgi:hypothetical protein